MPSVYDIKPAFQSLLRPLVRACAVFGVTPNMITLGALGLSLGYGAWIALSPEDPRVLIWLGPFLFVRMALNAIDGMLAREHGMTSALGGVLNELGDVVADTGLYLPLALVPGFGTTQVVLLVLLAGWSEMTGVIVQAQGGSRRYDGPMGKSDRAALLGVLTLVIGLGTVPVTVMSFVLPAVNVLLLVTILHRVRRGLAELSPDA